MRLDQYLTKNALAPSRNRASELIEGGFITVNDKIIKKNSYEIKDEDRVSVIGTDHDFVGRGGMKIEAALDNFGVVPSGLICVDIGASTGGFTDCLLMRGAKRVYAVDSGHGQLAEKLLVDERVVNLEGCNARYLDRTLIPEFCDLAVCDVSFISQTLIHASVKEILTESGVFLSLIKPQFECGREMLGKGGIVKDKKSHEYAIRRVVSSANEHGLSPIGIMKSPIKGGDGNTEFLLYMQKGAVSCVTSDEIRRAIHEET